MIHFVLHDSKDSVAVVVAEGVKAGMTLNGWIMDEDRMTSVKAAQDIPIGHKIALKDMAVGDTVWKYAVDSAKSSPRSIPANTRMSTTSRPSAGKQPHARRPRPSMG